VKGEGVSGKMGGGGKGRGKGEGEVTEFLRKYLIGHDGADPANCDEFPDGFIMTEISPQHPAISLDQGLVWLKVLSGSRICLAQGSVWLKDLSSSRFCLAQGSV
jgi:hypothetical protein